jgi:predicted acetyltransferase
MRHEFFRNVKYAIKDYELATKSQIVDKDTGQFKLTEHYIKKMAMGNDMVQLNILKERLLSTKLTNQQKNLIEQLTQLLYKYVE